MEASTSELTIGPAPRRRRPDLGGRSEEKVGRFLVAPGQLLLLFIVLFPAVIAIYIGFTAWSPTTGVDFWHAYEFWHWFDGYWEAKPVWERVTLRVEVAPAGGEAVTLDLVAPVPGLNRSSPAR